MSKYTITIKNLINNHFDFGLSSYPIFDEAYRETLNTKILNHYYLNEIGFETPELFKFYLNNKLNEIMPYFNTLYKKQTTLIDGFDNNINLTEKLERQSESNTKTENNGSSYSNSKNLYQDTPQGNISNTDIDNQKWATNLTLNNGTVNDNSLSNGSANGTENYIKTIIGNNGGKYGYEIFNDIKNNIINIDMMIINELEELFFGLL